jgi:hypothetical protein
MRKLTIYIYFCVLCMFVCRVEAELEKLIVGIT